MLETTFHGKIRRDWLQNQMKERGIDTLSLFNAMSLTTMPDLRKLEKMQNDNAPKISYDFWIAVKKAVRAFEPAPNL